MKQDQNQRGARQFCWIVLLLLLPAPCNSWITNIAPFTTRQRCLFMSTEDTPPATQEKLTLDSLIDMDIVIYSADETETKLFGALQEDGSLAPLSAWTTEPAFADAIEFLVDEEDRFSLASKNIKIHYLIQESELSYSNRQCHRGVDNPHGEESELLYYVDQQVIDKFDVKVVLNPDLEILW